MNTQYLFFSASQKKILRTYLDLLKTYSGRQWKHLRLFFIPNYLKAHIFSAHFATDLNMNSYFCQILIIVIMTLSWALQHIRCGLLIPAMCYFTEISQRTDEVGSELMKYNYPQLAEKKPRAQRACEFAQWHTARKWQSSLASRCIYSKARALDFSVSTSPTRENANGYQVREENLLHATNVTSSKKPSRYLQNRIGL